MLLHCLFALLVTGTEVDDAAKFLAGLPGPSGSAFKALEAEPAWQAHAKALDDLWAKYARKRKPAMESFQAAELVGEPIPGTDVWYPFSGPDVITMLAFFPGHTRYVMAALEPPGTVPKPGDLKSLGRALPAIAQTLSSVLYESFFVTVEMDKSLRGQVTDGVTQPILIQLARLGYTITGARYLQINEKGEMVDREKDTKRAAFGYNLSIAFDVQKDGGPTQTIYYVSLNLDDQHMKDNPGFNAYVRSLSNTATMLKATSYMVHDAQFSLIRDLVLERSAVIVQDDSGIPWRFFVPDLWKVQLYGEYSKPYGSFHFRVQNDLRDAFKSQAPKPLDFAIGYGSGKIKSNLEFAVKNVKK